MKTALNIHMEQYTATRRADLFTEMSDLGREELADNRQFKLDRSAAFHFVRSTCGKLLLVRDGAGDAMLSAIAERSFLYRALHIVTIRQHELACREFLATLFDHTYSPFDGLVMDNRISRFARMLEKDTSIDAISKQVGCGKRGLARKRYVDVVTREELGNRTLPVSFAPGSWNAIKGRILR